uniref:Doublecortin domain-containing protein n=1 Tax=Poecilia formosa TaxID=48698 RepID=A0A096LX07_POEFO
MSNTPIQDPPAQEMFSSSGQMLPSRPVQSVSEPSASKRVCFYKSGDYQFSGHRMIVTARTFKTFDALLDALSKKVPLPFGVRTITTPRGTHFVKALEDLQDGGAYVCSDQKRVKPLNLEEVNRRQVPWNATRPLHARRRKRQELKFHQFGRGTDPSNRPAKVTAKVAVRTPKKLTVIKNRDPTVRRTIVLQRRIAPTFDALLDYLSQILQFPVLKLYSTDGRRVDGLAALILCSGIIVAAGNEPFRLGNQRFHRAGQAAQIMYVEHVEPSMLNPRMQKDKSLSSGRGSRNFSASSERFIVNQINKSQKTMETCGPETEDNEHIGYVVPRDDDIEKSFHINQDGSMTVEMKVRLTIKEEEMLHWTTTLSRSGLNKKTACASLSGSDNNSPDSNNAVAKDSTGIEEDERKEANYHDGAARGVAFNEEHIYKGYSSTTLGRAKTRFKRTPTPGPQRVNERASVESVKMVTEAGFQQSTLGHYSYMERTADGETTEGYCVVRHSSSNKPVPKTRRTTSSGASSKRSSVKSSGVAEVLQIQNDGMEVTETVMHIYESQGCYDNYVANEELSADGTSLHGSPLVAESKPSTSSGPRSSSNDCDIDCNWQPPTTDSLERRKEEMLSLSSEAGSLTHQATNNLSSATENEAAGLQKVETVNKHNAAKSTKKKKIARPLFNEKSSVSTNSSDKKRQESIKGSSKHNKYSSTDKLSSNAIAGNKSLSSMERSKSSLNSKGTESSQSKKSIKDEKVKKDSALLLNPGNTKPSPQQKKSQIKIASNNGHNINSPTGRPQMKKNMSDILLAKKPLSPGQKTITRPKSMTECGLSNILLPKPPQELSETGSLPSLNPSPSEIHQYVENWLENANPDSVPYADEMITDGAETRAKVVFKIGDDSESDEINQCQTSLNDAMKKSSSCLSVPLYHEGLASGAQQGEQRARGLCVSMPSVRCDPENNENKLRLHKSVEAIGTNDSEMSSSQLLSPKAKLRPVLRQVCSSIQCIRRTSASSTAPTLQNSSSLPNFSTQVASVFGSSCKAFLSFLSVMTLRDNIKGSQLGEGSESRTSSEAMLMMESLQKISAMEDEEEQRASLTDLQSRASSQLRERWKDFQILRERLESEPLSPRVSETEFALDVVSDGGDAFDDQQMVLDELMEELNMPQDLREEIVSTIQQTKSFYPAEESTFEKDKELKNEKQEAETVNNLGNNENVNTDEEDDREELEREGDIDMEVKSEMQGDSEEEKTSEREFVKKLEEVEEAMTEDEEVTQNSLEEEDEGFAVEETGTADTVEDTDEREGAGETEEVKTLSELLDFVNDALQSYTLIFTYDTQGNIRIVPDNARVVQTKQSLIPKPRKDISYGLKCLPSPITSDLSDYRPETSGSGGYKTQESVDIVSENGEEPLEKANSTERSMLEQRHSRVSPSSCSLKSGNRPPSSDEGTKASREDLSYFSAASSLKAETEAETQNPQDAPLSFDKDSADGVLIDRGRWLLKENHLIRKSPPVSLGMYGNVDSTSTDTGQENTSVDSSSYTKTQHSPLAAISSSELEEMAKPLTPKCTYYNMPHGSDSDPFMEDVVSPIVDTSKTWANRNGSLSSFTSVEFKIPDRKVHPEVDSSAAMQPRRTSTGEQGALQAQDSLDSLHLRCGQYCPIL